MGVVSGCCVTVDFLFCAIVFTLCGWLAVFCDLIRLVCTYCGWVVECACLMWEFLGVVLIECLHGRFVCFRYNVV